MTEKTPDSRTSRALVIVVAKSLHITIGLFSAMKAVRNPIIDFPL